MFTTDGFGEHFRCRSIDYACVGGVSITIGNPHKHTYVLCTYSVGINDKKEDGETGSF